MPAQSKTPKTVPILRLIIHYWLMPNSLKLGKRHLHLSQQDAKVKLDEAQAKTMKDAMGDIQMPPGMNLPF